MTLSEQLFIYCERGLETGPLAEPLNAASNIAFLIAAIVAGRRLAAGRGNGAFAAGEYANRYAIIVAMIVLTALIGAGSFLFHILATRWAQAADVLPILLFMVLYLVFALRALVHLDWHLVAVLSAIFALVVIAAAFACASTAALGQRPVCLNGTLSYVPALAAMAAVGIVLHARGHPVARLLLTAAVLFALSMTARSLDLAVCDTVQLGGRPLSLHALWHLVNAGVLYLLLIAAMPPGPRCQAPANDA